MGLLPLFPVSDKTVMQWQTIWKSILDPLLKDSTSKPNIQISPINPYTPVPAGQSHTFHNLSVTITTTGRPISISLQPAPISDPKFDTTFSGTPPNSALWWVDGGFVSQKVEPVAIISINNGALPAYTVVLSPGDFVSLDGFQNAVEFPPGIVSAVDVQPAGTYTYSIFVDNTQTTASINPATVTFNVSNVILVAYEMGT